VGATGAARDVEGDSSSLAAALRCFFDGRWAL
jgi:hypothetical protein